MIKSTFKDDECIFLLKDLTGIIKEISLDEKEKLIAQGVNYSEMISKEEPISDEINEIFKKILSENADKLATCVDIIADKIYEISGENTIIVSLARAGSPVGVLIKRYIKNKYHVDVPHYSISIIRGKGIDEKALDYIVGYHPYGIMTFVDGWTGKGSITKELKKSISEYNKKNNMTISNSLAVIADPAKLAPIAGTKEDICIPNACLNSTVSGLVSRTIHNEEYIDGNDFHGAITFKDLAGNDMTNYFLDTIEEHFDYAYRPMPACIDNSYVPKVIKKLEKDFGVTDANKIKLSIGESSRALLRRKPSVMLVKNPENPDLSFLLHMAEKKGVEVRQYDTFDYECITILE
jgi:hypothetical protein